MEKSKEKKNKNITQTQGEKIINYFQKMYACVGPIHFFSRYNFLRMKKKRVANLAFFCRVFPFLKNLIYFRIYKKKKRLIFFWNKYFAKIGHTGG